MQSPRFIISFAKYDVENCYVTKRGTDRSNKGCVVTRYASFIARGKDKQETGLTHVFYNANLNNIIRFKSVTIYRRRFSPQSVGKT